METNWRAEAPKEWQALLRADEGAVPSHQPTIALALAQVVPGMSAQWVCVEREGTLIGGAPVLIERRAGAEWLHAMPMMLSGAPLASAGEHANVDAAIATAFSERVRQGGYVGGSWSCFRPSGERVTDRALERIAGETRWVEAAVLPLEGGVDAVLRRIDRKSRQALQHTLARGLHFGEEPDALEEAYALHLAQRTQWGAARALPLELARRLLGGDAPAARLFTVRDGRGLLSASLALDSDRETFLWWSGTHRDGRRSHAFSRLVWGVVEWAAERNRSRVDLGASTGLSLVADFKRSLGAESVRYPVRWFAAGRTTGLTAVIASLQGWVRRSRPRGERA